MDRYEYTHDLFVIVELHHLLDDVADMHHLKEFCQWRYIACVALERFRIRRVLL